MAIGLENDCEADQRFSRRGIAGFSLSEESSVTTLSVGGRPRRESRGWFSGKEAKGVAVELLLCLEISRGEQLES
jgi:hypothetical protein